MTTLKSASSAAASGLPRFWEQLPTCFLAPLRPAHLMLYLLLAGGALVLGLMYSLNAWVYLTVAACGYAFLTVRLLGGSVFKVMDAGSRGLFDPDLTSLEPDDDVIRGLPWKMFGVTMVTGFVAGLIGTVAPWMAVVVQFLLMLAWPAQLVLLVRDQSVLSAASPSRWLDVVQAMGKSYFALALFQWLMSAGTGVMAALLLPRSSPMLILPVLVVVIGYFGHATGYLMGYAMFQYHEQLGIDADARAEIGKPKEDGPAERIGALVAAGELAAAIDLAYEDQRTNPDSPAAHERFHRVLLLGDERDRALAHGRRYLGLLMTRGMTTEAFKLLTELRALDAEFRPDDAAHELPLAQAALRRQEPELALALLRGFDKRNRGHAQVPDVYLFTARLLATQYRDERTAVAILRTLLARHAGSAAAVEAKILLDSLAPAGG
ncbi:tetratricopeptide repeat protein [Derxia gummosa]|uniref:Tetratricopeptide repeat protein n=1 Tax=Derxia gummosa DSM 723 TaxID=1121388 RepID=A0A8B6X5Y8_9BURK|nr:hypothetical protein [Derxia gummosa]